MTYHDVLRLPPGTAVLLADGRTGRVVSWYHTAESVGVRVGMQPAIVIQCARLSPNGTGALIESAG